MTVALPLPRSQAACVGGTRHVLIASQVLAEEATIVPHHSEGPAAHYAGRAHPTSRAKFRPSVTITRWKTHAARRDHAVRAGEREAELTAVVLSPAPQGAIAPQRAGMSSTVRACAAAAATCSQRPPPLGAGRVALTICSPEGSLRFGLRPNEGPELLGEPRTVALCCSREPARTGGECPSQLRSMPRSHPRTVRLAASHAALS
jgi:hypothetical protein